MTGTPNCLVILGATASGKTQLAANIAATVNGEVISADSRQVYKHLDIGTGKDYADYIVNGNQIPYHCIDIAEPEEQFFLHNYMEALDNAFVAVSNKQKLPIICGGSGLYLDTLRHNFELTAVPENPDLRLQLDKLSKPELLEKLAGMNKRYTTQVDISSRKRIVRGIEIAIYLEQYGMPPLKQRPQFEPVYIGITSPDHTRVQNIRTRLQKRLKEGLIKEAEMLLQRGLSHQRLQFLGLEYAYLSDFLLGKCTYDKLETALAEAIIKFSKRQITWFKRMEKQGVKIHWVEKNCPFEEVLALIPDSLKQRI